jgi:hypothetical protein
MKNVQKYQRNNGNIMYYRFRGDKMMKRHLLGIGIIQLLVCYFLMACSSTEQKTEVLEDNVIDAIRFVEIPDCKMVSSGIIMLGGDKFMRFMNWFSSLPPNIYSQDFLFNDGNGFHWLWVYTEGLKVPAEYNIIDFKGGAYAVSCGLDRGVIKQSDYVAMIKIKKEFLEKYGYEIDESRPELRHILSDKLGPEILGYEQMDYWTPIKPISK